MQIHRKRIAAIAFLILALAQPATARARGHDRWTVHPEWVRAHETFLAGDALRGRGSATPDEAVAAAYVAAQFESFGLATAPGMNSYLQTANVIRFGLKGPVRITADGAALAAPVVLMASGESIHGKSILTAATKAADLPSAEVVIATAPAAPALAFARAARGKHIRLLILRESEDTRLVFARLGNAPSMPAFLEGGSPDRPTIVTLPAAAFDSLAARPGADIVFDPGEVTRDKNVTTNAIGYLAGSDPKAGTLLLSAHLDHLGVRPDGIVMHGANDDASGTVAVMELARAMAAGRKPRRSILFVCYGSEEIGEYGSQYFAAHPPIPLAGLVANIEFEMIGAQDPKLPQGAMMMTGYERSSLGAALKAHGALVAGDPYPDQHFFERSDNYQLALTGIVAHTLSGWAVTPTYHQPTDTVANLNFPFMTKAIQSLIAPVRWLANSDFQPQWKQGGRPAR